MIDNSGNSQGLNWFDKLVIYSAILIGAVSCSLRYHNGYDSTHPANSKNGDELASMIDAGDYFVQNRNWEEAIKHYNKKFELDGGGTWQDYFVMSLAHHQLAFQYFSMVSWSNSEFSETSSFSDMFLDSAVDNCWQAREYIAGVPEKHDEKVLHGEKVGYTREGIDFLCDKIEVMKYGTQLVR
jgi:hypothetical protein